MKFTSLKLSAGIAKTQLLSKPRQTLVAMLGVTFGIGMFIALISMMTGLNKLTEDLAMTSSPDIRMYYDISPDRKSIAEFINPQGLTITHHQKPKNESLKVRNAKQIAEQIRKRPNVKGASILLNSQVFYNYGPVQLNGTIDGVDILEEDKLFDLTHKMKEGRIENLISNPDGIIMGTGLAKKLRAKTGDRVVITTPQGFTQTLKIVGLFQIGIGIVDNTRSYANLSTVQTILQKDKSFITDVNVKLYDYTKAKELAPVLQKDFGYKAEDWETANATLLVGAIIRNIITYSVSITLLIVAGFGIYNILNITIHNKMKDIAILKAMGFSGPDVRSIFMIQSLVIGFFGSLMGLIFGLVFSYLISLAPFNGGDIISITHLPVNFNPLFYVIGIVFGVATTAIAGYMPSRKAAHVDPIEILRG